MSMENFRSASDEELLDAAREIAEEAELRGLRIPRALGELAGDAVDLADYDDDDERDDEDPFLKPGSSAARRYAHGKGTSGLPRWMERFSPTDMFGRPTVFSSSYDPTDRGV